jgi:penicillin-binding protein-related factor A (putative recombinase)
LSCTKLSFSIKNICDYICFYKGKLYLFELKSISGKSFKFEITDHKVFIDKETGEKTIEWTQINKFLEKTKVEGITAGFIINFRDVEKTVFIDVQEMRRIIETCGKKSFNLQDLENYKYTNIENKKLKVHYRYDIEKFLFDIIPF